MKYLIKTVFDRIVLLPIILMLAIGRFYDERIGVLTVVISILYFISLATILWTLHIKDIHFDYFWFSFFSIIIIFNFVLICFDNVTISDYSISKFLFFIVFIVPVYLFFSFSNSSTYRDAFISYLLIISIFMLCAGIYKFLREGLTSDDNRFSVLGGGPIVFARWLFIGFIILSFTKDSSKYFKILFFTLAIIFGLLSGSKGPLINLAISYLCFFIIQQKKMSLKSGLRLILGIIFLSSLIYIVYELSLTLEIENLSRLFEVSDSDALNEANTIITRFQRFNVALNIIIDKPLFGVGIGNFANVASQYGDNSNFEENDYPHNLFLEIGSELGLLALFLFFIFLASVYIKLVKLIHIDKWRGGLYFCLITFLLLNSMLSGNLLDSRLLFILCAMIVPEFIYLKRAIKS